MNNAKHYQFPIVEELWLYFLYAVDVRYPSLNNDKRDYWAAALPSSSRMTYVILGCSMKWDSHQPSHVNCVPSDHLSKVLPQIMVHHVCPLTWKNSPTYQTCKTHELSKISEAQKAQSRWNTTCFIWCKCDSIGIVMDVATDTIVVVSQVMSMSFIFAIEMCEANDWQLLKSRA